jgi:hypothetical protein
MEKEYYRDLAYQYDGVTFNGFQNVPNGKPMPMFTHLKYGTFVLQNNETLDEAIERKRIQFQQ